MSPSRSHRPPPAAALDEAAIGQCIHAVVGELLAKGVRTPRPEELLSTVAGNELLQESVAAYRQAAKQRVLSGVSLYFRLFLPASQWRYGGSELQAGPRRLDLIWRHGSGEIMADELKSGRAVGFDSRRSLEAQVAAQVAVGVERFGAEFVGVRAILLAAPRRSYLLRADGTSENLVL